MELAFVRIIAIRSIPIPKPELKEKLLEHLKVNCKDKDIWLDTINCVSDHIHLLISIGSEQTISKVAMLIKGESSYWINKNKIFRKKFEWQDEYFAVSVSESGVNRVRDYIKNQETHHKKKTFADEYQEFMRKYKFDAFVSGLPADKAG